MKRKFISFEAKLKLTEAVEKGDKTKAEICCENGIAQSSLFTILKESQKIQTAVEQGTRQHKKQRTSTYADLLLWFKQARSMDIPISGPSLLEKGEELARELGHTNCKLSGGWIQRFKIRMPSS